MNSHHSQSQQSSESRHDDDAALTDFLASLMEYTPTVPDELVEHYLGKSGFQCPDVRLRDESTARLGTVGSEAVDSELLRAGKIFLVSAFWGCGIKESKKLTRLVAVATQKFVADIASDALQHCRARQTTVVKDKRDKQQKDKRLILTMDDLSKALREYGVNVKHQEYFADSPSAGLDTASRDE